MGHRWIAGLANYNFHIHYKSGKSNDETIQTDSIQAIVAAATVADVANIEAVSCSVQLVKSFFLIPSDTIAICKAITRLSDQSCMTRLEPESSVLQTESKVDDSDHLALSGPSEDKLNPKCMTKQDWVEDKSKDKTIGEIIHKFKTKKLYCRKINELTTMR